MTIYIAGPMTGYSDMNFPAFNAAAERLRSAGFSVVNPVDINPDPDADWTDCMIKDIEALMECNAIYLLHGWEKSKGARIERAIAGGLGYNIMYEGEVHAKENQ